MPRRRSTGPSRRCDATATTLRPRSRERRRRERRPADARPPRRRRALRRAGPDLPAPGRGRRGRPVRPAAGPRPAPRRELRPGPSGGADRRPAAEARGAAGREQPAVTVPTTLAEIEAAIAHDEANLADYRSSLAKREAKGHDTTQTRELVRLVEKRLAMLNDRKHVAEANEGPGRPGTWGWRRP